MLTRDLNVHTEETTDQIHRDQDRRDKSNLTKNLVDMVSKNEIGNVQLGKVIRMRAAEHFLEMRQVRHHGHDVILNITEIQADIAARCNGVLLVAAFREAADDVCFAAKQPHERHDFFPETADAREEGFEVIDSGDEDVVFYGFGFKFDVADDRAETINDVITRKLSVNFSFRLTYNFFVWGSAHIMA